MLTFIDQSGQFTPRNEDPGSVLTAVCMRESTLVGLTRLSYTIKKNYKWVRDDDGRPSEIHAVECATQNAYQERNTRPARKWRVFKDVLANALKREVSILMILMDRPEEDPQTRGGELPSEYFLLLQRVEAVAAHWREAQAHVVFDEEDRNGDRKRAFAYENLLQRCWGGRYFSRLTAIPSFGDSAASIGLQLADMCAYTVFIDKYGSKIRSKKPLAEDYRDAIGKLAELIYLKSPTLPNFRSSQSDKLPGIYKMPERYFREPARP